MERLQHVSTRGPSVLSPTPVQAGRFPAVGSSFILPGRLYLVNPTIQEADYLHGAAPVFKNGGTYAKRIG